MRDMKITGMRAAGVFSAALLGVVMLAQPGRLVAQGTASIHGKVTNPAGMAVANAEVRLTTEKNPNTANPKFDYSFPTDAGGNYKGADIKPGTYMAVVYQGANHVDFMPATLAAGDDKTIDFDMTRKEYIDKMSPADRAALERSTRRMLRRRLRRTRRSGT